MNGLEGRENLGRVCVQTKRGFVAENSFTC